VAPVVIFLDVVEDDRLGEVAGLVDVPRKSPEVRVVDDSPSVQREVDVVDVVEPDEGRERWKSASATRSPGRYRWSARTASQRSRASKTRSAARSYSACSVANPAW